MTVYSVYTVHRWFLYCRQKRDQIVACMQKVITVHVMLEVVSQVDQGALKRFSPRQPVSLPVPNLSCSQPDCSDITTMTSPLGKLCAVCLKIFDSGKGDAVTSSQDDGQFSGLEQTVTQEQSREESDWRRGPGEYFLFIHSASSR